MVSSDQRWLYDKADSEAIILTEDQVEQFVNSVARKTIDMRIDDDSARDAAYAELGL